MVEMAAELTSRQRALRNYLEVLLSELVFCDFLDGEAFKFPKSEKEIQEIVKTVIPTVSKSVFDDSYDSQKTCLIFGFGPCTYVLCGTDELYVKVHGLYTQICSVRKFDGFSLQIDVNGVFLESGNNCYGNWGNDYVVYSKDKMLSLLRKQYMNILG